MIAKLLNVDENVVTCMNYQKQTEETGKREEGYRDMSGEVSKGETIEYKREVFSDGVYTRMGSVSLCVKGMGVIE